MGCHHTDNRLGCPRRARGHRAADPPVCLASAFIHIHDHRGWRDTTDSSTVTVKHGSKSKHCIVHPALLKRPSRVAGNTVYISIEALKYAKPFALKRITDSFNE